MSQYNQQKPSKGNAHVHETQHTVVFEYFTMDQTFQEYFLCGKKYFATEKAFAQFFAVFVGQFPDGIDDSSNKIQTDEDKADHERQYEWVVYETFAHLLKLRVL